MGCFPDVKSSGGVNLTSHLHMVSRLGIRGAVPPTPLMFSVFLEEKLTRHTLPRNVCRALDVISWIYRNKVDCAGSIKQLLREIRG